MRKREKFAALGAAHAGALALAHWGQAYQIVVPPIGHESIGILTCGRAEVAVRHDQLTVVVGHKSMCLGPVKWQHAAAAPWLAWVADTHGLDAAYDAAHALGVGRPAKPAWRNRYSGTPQGTDTGLWSGHYTVAPLCLSAYLACFEAVGLRAEDEDARPAIEWQLAQTMQGQ